MGGRRKAAGVWGWWQGAAVSPGLVAPRGAKEGAGGRRGRRGLTGGRGGMVEGGRSDLNISPVQQCSSPSYDVL